MHRHTHILTLASLLTACQLDPKDIGTPDTAGEATMTSSGAAPSTGDLTGGPATDGTDTGDDPITTTATDVSAGTVGSASDTLDTDSTAGSASDTLGTDGSASDTLDTDGNDTEEDLPAECDEADPTVDATYSLDIPGWPDDPNVFGINFDVQCTVDAVDAPGDTVTTALTCVVEGDPLPGTLVLAGAPEGPAAWQAGDAVHLIYRDSKDEDFSQVRALELRRGADDDLLVSANDSVIDEQFEGRFAPLTVNLVFACGVPDGTVPQRVDFTPVGGDTVSIFHRHRGLLPLSADEGFAIDVEDARADGLHTEGNLKVLLRRVDLTP